MRLSVLPRGVCLSLTALLIGACSGDFGEQEDTGLLASEYSEVTSGPVTATLTVNHWGSGFTATVRVHNRGTTATSGWSVDVQTTGYQIANLWNGVQAPNGSNVVRVSNASHNGRIAPNSYVEFGFQGNGSGRPELLTMTQSGASGGSGGSSGSGGSTGGTGGTPATGGTGGTPATGGTGGTPATGGTGGTPATGGTGGTPGTGGGTNSGNPFAGATFYLDPNMPAASAERTARQQGRTAEADKLRDISTTPQGEWIGGWNGDPESAVRGALSRANGQLRVLVAYNIYNRDCGSYSAGGASSPAAYRTWIDGFARGVGAVPGTKAVIVLEPDALAHNCGSSTPSDSTAALLNYAVGRLEAQPNAYVYIDAGNANWIGASDMANRLRQAGISSATGFAVNVSNYYDTSRSVSYGKSVSSAVGGKPFIVDTSRNGIGTSGSEWCNPRPRGLGKKSTANTGDSAVHALFWIKRPGESDGTCGGGPAAGQWYNDYALHLWDNRRF